MEVVFERVDERRYLIGVRRNARTDVGADIWPRPGPGHAEVPHDLVHFVVEEQAGCRWGSTVRWLRVGRSAGSSAPLRATATRPLTSAGLAAGVGRRR